MEAVIYRRVSTKKQDDEGKSLADQDAELDAYLKALGYTIVGNYSDAISGRREKTDKRIGLNKAIALACKRKATLAVADLDRLARSQSAGMRLVESLQDCGAGLVVKSLGVDTNTLAGKMILGVMFAMAEWTSGNIGKGVARANAATVKRLRYRTNGRQPYGWKIEGGRRVKIHAEQLALGVIRDRRSRGGTCTQIADALNTLGHPSPSGKPWKCQTVKRIVSRL